MKNSNNAKTIGQVQNHMVRMVRGKKKLYEDIKHQTKDYGSVRRALAVMFDEGRFLIYNKDIYNFLNRLGYTKAQLEKMDVGERYKQLIVRDGSRFYEQYKKELALKKRK